MSTEGHGVDQDTLRCQFEGHGLRQFDDAGLGGDISALQAQGHQTGDGGDVDDAAASGLQLGGNCGFRADEDALEIDLDHAVPSVCGNWWIGTRAIIVAHTAGDPVDIDPVMELAHARNFYVIECCAQPHDAKYKVRLVGTIGDAAAFFTMYGKHHCTGGQVGIVYTQDEQLHQNARRSADRGKPFNANAPANVVAGPNCNLNELSTAIDSAQLS